MIIPIDQTKVTEAFKMLDQFIAHGSAAPGLDLPLLPEVIEAAAYAGKFETAQALCELFSARTQLAYAGSTVIAEVCQVLQARNLGQEHTGQCNAIAFAFLREKEILPKLFEVQADLDDKIVFFKIGMDLPFEQFYELDDQLMRRMIVEVDNFSPSAYWLGLDYFGGADVHLASLRKYRGHLPSDFKFDRFDTNARCDGRLK